MDVALIGCGFIGSLISERIASGEVPVNLKIVLDRHEEKVKNIQERFDEPPIAAVGIEDIASSEVDLVIEAASIGAVQSFSEGILESGKDMMIMSVGAFADPSFYQNVENISREKSVNVYLPSGAIGGLDAISSASVGGLDAVELTTTKHPRSLEGAPYLVEQKIDLVGMTEPKVVFEGSAREAIEGFPANVNVAVAISLAGIGADKTSVKIVADPTTELNKHEVRAQGDFGMLYFKSENHPSPDNPRTSLLAALSAISMLKKIVSPIKVG